MTWLGHSAFKIDVNGTVFIFDPWIEGNPSSPLDGYGEILKADYVLVSHDHQDHGLVDGAKISRHTGAKFVGVFELANRAKELGAENILPGNIGGTIMDDDVSIHFALAHHSCGIGTPCGFVVGTPELTVYHAGDTSLHYEMKLLGDRWNIDLALLPIGSTYTMDPADAATAADLLNAKRAIPMHYNTFPQIEMDPRKFKTLVGERESSCKVIILEPGASVTLERISEVFNT